MKLYKIICIAFIVLFLSSSFYFTGIGFETKYYVTKLNTGKWAWKKTRGGYRYNSTFTYNTYEKANEMARQHAKDSRCIKKLIVEEIPVDLD